MAQADGNHNFALNANAFSKCAPAISTNLKQCGTITICNAVPTQAQDLLGVYSTNGNYRLMRALLMHDIEIKACSAVTNGMYDFLMANKVPLHKKLNTRKLDSGTLQVAPFIMARQYTPINNEFWQVMSGQTAGGGNWECAVQSSGNVPADVRSFYAGERVAISSISAGTSTFTLWQIVSSTFINGNAVLLVLSPQNSGSFLGAAQLVSPVNGVLTRIPANIDDYESYCAEPTAYLNWNNVPFWIETMRLGSMCTGELYDQWRAALLADNDLYREFGDLPEIERNKQIAMDSQKRIVNNFFWGKAINANQTLNAYNSLPQIQTNVGNVLDLGGAKCVGFRANLVGIYEQHAQCGRTMDLQGGTLDLIALFNSIYQMYRVRIGAGKAAPEQFDVFTDSQYAELINQAMIAYYNAKSQNTMRLMLDVNQDTKKAEFGFNYRSYNLFYPMQVRFNVCSHFFFDDWLSAGLAASTGNANRVLWVMDFSGIYPGIIKSESVVRNIGNINVLSEIDQSFSCQIKNPWTKQRLFSMTATMVCECVLGNLLINNMAFTLPVAANATPPVYPPTSSTTTTTTTL